MPEARFERNPNRGEKDDDKGEGDPIPEEELERQSAERNPDADKGTAPDRTDPAE